MLPVQAQFYFHNFFRENIISLCIESSLWTQLRRFHNNFSSSYSANSYVRDSKTAEDIVHDSFMAVWEHRNDITRTNIEAYLYKVIRNNCLMYRRNRQIGQAVYEQIKLKERSTMDYYTRAIESCDPDTLLQDEILEICRAQLEQMPELTQQIFKARRLEGKSYKEIAEQFGIPQKKVDKQLQQAVIKLRRALKDFFSIIFTM